MALLVFNFDGTGNEPQDAQQDIKKGKKEDDNITNILKFHFLCGGNLHADSSKGKSSHASVKHCFYYQGVGTYGNWWQRLINQGLSPESKNIATILFNAFQDFKNVYQQGDQIIVTGFSRGAALARRFCAKLIEKSALLNDDTQPCVYLAVFDTVASIGLPNLSKTERPDYDVVFENGCTVTPIVKQAIHMLSIDDKRKAFQPTLMNYDQSRIVELWFAGAHSDVGGGYYRDGLSDITLTCLIDWVLHQVRFNHLIDPKLKFPNQQELNELLPEKLINKIGVDDLCRVANELGKNHQQDRWPIIDWVTLDDRFCCVVENDQVAKEHRPILHSSVPTRIALDKDYRPKSLLNLPHKIWRSFTQECDEGVGIKNYFNNPTARWFALEIGQSIIASVEAVKLFNHTGILVEKSERYKITASPEDTWTDGEISCNANGWNSSDVSQGWKEIPIKIARKLKRVKSADWFTLCVSVGRSDDLAKALGVTGEYNVTHDGELTFFANDLKAKMDNNIGNIKVTIKRIE